MLYPYCSGWTSAIGLVPEGRHEALVSPMLAAFLEPAWMVERVEREPTEFDEGFAVFVLENGMR